MILTDEINKLLQQHPDHIKNHPEKYKGQVLFLRSTFEPKLFFSLSTTNYNTLMEQLKYLIKNAYTSLKEKGAEEVFLTDFVRMIDSDYYELRFIGCLKDSLDFTEDSLYNNIGNLITGFTQED